jgi:Zn-dependent peptidase ImmA (M78 family)/transcriptional regulator with XRE-family HTH domain
MTSGTPGFVGDRLRQSREAMGFTMTALAEILGVSKQAVSQYEKGADSPREEVFAKMCRLFQHEPHFFLLPVNSALHLPVFFFRSMATTTKTARTKAQVRHMWMREVVNYLGDFVEFPPVHFPPDVYSSDPNALSMEEVEQASAKLREFWKLGEGPIVNLVRTMENNGAIILRHPLDAETLDAVSGWAEPEGLPYVLLNSDKSCSVRSRLDLAHELGHMVLHRNVTETTLNKGELFAMVETQAFRFGASFLLPEEPFLDDLHSLSLDALKVLKRKWRVSIAMMIERLKHLGVIDAEQHRRLRINYVGRKWTRQEPFDDEIPIEEPTVLAAAFQLIVSENIHSVEEISANTGFSKHWLQTLMSAPLDLFSPPPQVGLKVIPFRKPA